jgi:hypothetical protein
MADDGWAPLDEFGCNFGSLQLALYITFEWLVGDTAHIC